MIRHADIRAYTAPQERFEDLRRTTLTRFGADFCDLAYANPYDGPSAEVRSALRATLDDSRTLDLQYTPYGGAPLPRRIIAQNLRRSHAAPFRWRHVVLTPGAMAAINVLFRSLQTQRDDDEVIVVTPCWLDYPLYLANLGITARMVPLQPKSFSLDLEAIAKAVNPATRALILSQPCNPTGRVYAEQELRQLAKLLEDSEAQPVLISDECHRDIIFKPGFHSPSSFYDRTCVVYSFGKSLFLQGQRIGYVAVSPSFPDALEYAHELEQWCRVMGFCTPTALMQRALPALMKIGHDWHAIENRRGLVLRAFADHGLEIVTSEGGLFVYCPAGDVDDMAQLERLANRGVLVLPSSVFHHQGYLRIALTASDAAVEHALEHLVAVISYGGGA